MLPPGSRRSKIRPPRKSLVSSSIGNSSGDSVVDYDLSWSVLSNAITQIQNKNVSKLSYEQLYRKAYILVLRKYGAKLYDDVSLLIKQHLLHKRQNLLTILNLSSSLNNSINEDFMKAVLVEWDEHLQSMKFISDVLMYLNRVYVKEHKKLLIYDMGIQLFKDNIIKHENNELGSKLIEIVVDEITKNRKGEVITTKMYITKIINMLELLIETSNSGNDLQYGENYYQRYFEPIFLASSETFFYNLSQEFMNNVLGTKYLHDAYRFIKEEENRINFYLPASTYPKIIDLMNNIIIKDKIDKILCLPLEQQGLSYWLEPVLSNIFDQNLSSKGGNHHFTELKILYELLGRIDPDYGLFKTRLKDLVIFQGNTLPSLVKETISVKDDSSSSKKSSSNSTAFASTWINSILEYQNQFSKIVKESFSGDAILEQCITMGMREFINGALNASSGSKKLNTSSGSSAPELLSIYMDYRIKQLTKNPGSSSKSISNENDNDMNGSSVDQTDDLINKSVAFLRFVKDKDAFEAHYANHFAKRFLNFKTSSQGTSVSSNGKLGVDIEELIISKLGEEMGTTSLHKVIKMDKDIKLSRELTKDWKSYVNQNHKKSLIELDLKVCNVSDWPKSMTKDYKKFARDDTNNEIGFIWSRQLRSTIKEFEEFWFTNKRNDNKSLYWCPKFGSMDLRITYPTKTYDISMSTYAGIIMLLFAPQSTDSGGNEVLAFDEMRELTYDEIRELTGIPEADLKRQLQSIAVAPRLRLLIKVPMTKEVNNSDVFKLNEKFKSPSTKVKVLTVSASSSGASSLKVSTSNDAASAKTVQEEEFEEVESSILEGRKIEINAAIVRIMKSRRTINHNDLISELVKQLQNRFQTLNILIKRRIEDLIEKEYLKRDDNDRSLYHYVA